MREARTRDFYLAAQAASHEAGVDQLAEQLGCAPSTLYNKLNPNDETAKLTAEDIIRITRLTGSSAMAEVMARIAGGVFYRLPDLSKIPDAELFDLILDEGSMTGDFHSHLRKFLDDRRLEAAEFARLEQDICAVISGWVEIKARLETMVAS